MILTGHRRDIDGLRALAVLPVVFYHAGMGFSGGFVGVDVFFVISGYLITGILVRDLDAGQFSLLDFWHRRVRRIMPALVAMILSVLVVGGFLLIPSDYKELGQSALAQSFLGSNIFFWDDTDYFAADADTKALLHTWSLAVEEQFYLLFPLVLGALWRKRKCHKGARRLILILLFVSLLVSLPGPMWYPQFSFFWLPTRAWELLSGALIVFLPGVGNKTTSTVLAAIGLGGILTAVFSFTVATPFPGLAAILPCVGTVLLIWSGTQNVTLLHWLLGWSPLVFVGLISYSLYLWHWPVLVFSRMFLVEEATTNFILFQIFLSFIIATFSWRWIETPFRRKTWMRGQCQMLRFGIVCTVVVALCGIVLSSTKGLPSRLPDRVKLLATDPPNVHFSTKVDIGVTHSEVEADHVLSLGDNKSSKPVFVVWGDSHAMSASPVFDVLGKELNRRGFLLARAGTPPVLNFWRPAQGVEAFEYGEAAFEFIKRHKVNQVFLVAFWDHYSGGDDNPYYKSMGYFTDDPKQEGTLESQWVALRRQLSATVSKIKACGAEVFLLRQVPQQSVHVLNTLSARLLAGMSIENIGTPLETYLSRQLRINALLDDMSGIGATVLDTYKPLMNDNLRTILIYEGRATYEDDDHLSAQGALMLRPVIAPWLELHR